MNLYLVQTMDEVLKQALARPADADHADAGRGVEVESTSASDTITH